MRTMKMLVALGVVVLMAGCLVPSLNPLFTEKELIFDPALVGTWAEEGEKDTWTFQKSGDNAYELIYYQHEYTTDLFGGKTEPGEIAKFEAHLGRLGDFLFLDLYPEEPYIKNDFYRFHLIPAHTFSKVWIEGDVLRLAMFDPDWLEDMIAQKKVNIAHGRLDGMDNSIVLTASTEELQEFVLKYAEDTKAFPEPLELHRQK